MGNRKKQANKLFASRIDFWRRSTEKANCLNNTFTASTDVGKIIFETSE